LKSNEARQPGGLTDETAREMIEVSRAIENMASRAAEQLEATFFAYTRDLRERAQEQLKGPSKAPGADDSAD
jgi:hypothetical protein